MHVSIFTYIFFFCYFFGCFSNIGQAVIRKESTIRHALTRQALDFIAVPYVWGGTDARRGFDCSGFVRYIYQKQKLYLPRVSRDMFKHTYYLKPRSSTVRPGDLIFFSMKRPTSRKVDHVGIYLGREYFIHASFSRGIVIDSLLNDYYKRRLISIRRHKSFFN